MKNVVIQKQKSFVDVKYLKMSLRFKSRYKCSKVERSGGLLIESREKDILR